MTHIRVDSHTRGNKKKLNSTCSMGNLINTSLTLLGGGD